MKNIKIEYVLHRGRNFKEPEYKNIRMYTHYTSASAVDSIFYSGLLKASCLKNCNDLNETNLHFDDANKTYILCFCATDKEQIPLWYLYAGIDGKGVRLELGKKQMEEFISSIKKVHSSEGRDYELGKDYTIEQGLVTYIDKEKMTTKISGKCYEIIDYASDKLKESFFIKDYEWNYEKEFRIVFKFNENVGENICIPIDISLLNYLFAPEINDEEKKSLLGKQGFKEHAFRRLKQSKLKIRMKLTDRNWKKFIEYIKKESDLNNSEAENFKNEIIEILNEKGDK